MKIYCRNSIVASALFILLVFLAGCSLPSPEKKRDALRIKHNYIILLDLSGRVMKEENQSERDKQIIKNLYSLFEKKVRNDLYIKSRDEIKVVVAPGSGSVQDLSDFGDRLRVNIDKTNIAFRKAKEEERRKDFFSNLDSLYEQAIASQNPGDSLPADIGKYLERDLRKDYSRDTLTKNFLFILTDGHPDEKENKTKYRAVKSEYPDLEIVLLETDYDETDLEWGSVAAIWENWFYRIGIEKYTLIKKGLLARELEQLEGIVMLGNTTSKSIPVASQLIYPESSVSIPVDRSELKEIYQNEKRYALIIGNASYKRVAPLRNPVNDATDLSDALLKLNFEVITLTDATYMEIRSAFLKFHEKLASGPPGHTVGLFYYSGHGMQEDGENYLMPVDANVEFEDDIPRQGFPVQKIVLSNMERSNSRMNILILDACRNNTFPAATRTIGTGLAEMKKGRGSFIAYATAPGSTASDGPGRNGLYTQELLKAIQIPGLSIEQVFKEVRKNVLRLSGERQNPWDSSNITGDFYFNLN